MLLIARLLITLLLIALLLVRLRRGRLITRRRHRLRATIVIEAVEIRHAAVVAIGRGLERLGIARRRRIALRESLGAQARAATADTAKAVANVEERRLNIMPLL